MSKKKRNREESHEVSVSESGDTITVGDVGPGAAAAVGRGASASVTQSVRQSSDLAAVLAQWRGQMETKIDDQPDLSIEEKKDLKEQVEKIESEAAKGDDADPSRLEKLINTLCVMAPDIFEVAVTTLANPLAGIGVALKKIGDKAKLEVEPRAP